jgi:membrane dipeptidase
MQLRWTDLGNPRANAADGAEVDILGWMATALPATRAGYFLLAPEPPCCRGCLPGDPLGAIEVFAATPLPVEMRAAVRLRGTWRVVPADDPTGWRYQLLGARPLDPPGWRDISRRAVLGGGPLLCLAACTGAATADDEPARRQREAAARAAIAGTVTVDIHSHAGGIAGTRRIASANPPPFTPVAAPMRAGGMAALCLAIVSDGPTHRVMVDGRIHPFRDPAPGELYAYGQRCFQRLHELIREQGLAVITDPKGLDAARGRTPSAIVTAEGGDFLEGLAGRVDEAYARWQLRQLQLTHYRVNELGDIQTEAPVHGGLTDAGAEVIRRCNRLGVVVDVAHGTYDLVKRAASVSSRPLVLSHTSLNATPGLRSRTISPEHASVVAATGGVIGVWPPASIYPSLPMMARGMARLVDVVGVDHVGLGSDMQGLVGPSTFGSYELLPELAAALLETGFSPAETGKLLGGNYARVFAAALA